MLKADDVRRGKATSSIMLVFVRFKLSSTVGLNLLEPHTDLPLLLILSVYTDFLPFECGKILIFFLKIW